MSRKHRRAKLTGRKEIRGGFSAWPRDCHEHPSYRVLGNSAKALLHELLYQFRGQNNGDLCCAWQIVGPRWRGSRNTVDRAEAELIARGWIVRTRQGGRNAPHLYALTFLPMDACGGKLDAGWKAGGPPLGYWKLGRNPIGSEAAAAA